MTIFGINLPIGEMGSIEKLTTNLPLCNGTIIVLKIKPLISVSVFTNFVIQKAWQKTNTNHRTFLSSAGARPTIPIIHCVPENTCDHVFGDNLQYNCPFTKIFGILITKTIGHGQVFLFSHLTYLLQLLVFTSWNCQDLSVKIKYNHEIFTGRRDSD